MPFNNISDAGLWFCGEYTQAFNTSVLVNATSPLPVDVWGQSICYGLSLASALLMLVILMYTKLTGSCAKHYSLQSSDHIISMMVFIVIQSCAYFISASVDFNSANFGDAVCTFQGGLYQFGVCGIVLEIGAMSYMTYETIVSSVALADLYQQKRKRVFLVVYGVAFFFAVVPVIVQVGSWGEILVFRKSPQNVICWLSDCVGGLVAFVMTWFMVVMVYSCVVCVKVMMIVLQTFRNRNSTPKSTARVFSIRRLVFVVAVTAYMLTCLAYVVVMKLAFVGEATRDSLNVVVMVFTCADGFWVALFFILPDSVFQASVCCCCCHAGASSGALGHGTLRIAGRGASAVSLVHSSLESDPGNAYGYLSDMRSDDVSEDEEVSI